MVELVEDLVDEILCRVPATYLKRLRSTCKRWNRLYYDPKFARKHLDKSPKQFLLLMLTKDMSIRRLNINLTTQIFGSIIVPSVELKDKLSLIDPNHSPYHQSNIYRVFHCDGLLLCTYRSDDSRMVVWNPCTGETKWIEISSGVGIGIGKYRISVLGYSDKGLKILSFSSSKTEKVWEIYEFEDDSWRILEHGLAPGWYVDSFSPHVSWKGNTYMYALDGTKYRHLVSLIKFDFSTEKFEHLPFPYQRGDYKGKSLSIVREEKLAVLLQLQGKSTIEIWLTNKMNEGTNVVSWSKVLALELGPDIYLSYYTTFLYEEEKKLLVFSWKDMISIVGEDNQFTHACFGYSEKESAILYYVPSLVRIEPAGCKRKRGDD